MSGTVTVVVQSPAEIKVVPRAGSETGIERLLRAWAEKLDREITADSEIITTAGFRWVELPDKKKQALLDAANRSLSTRRAARVSGASRRGKG